MKGETVNNISNGVRESGIATSSNMNPSAIMERSRRLPPVERDQFLLNQVGKISYAAGHADTEGERRISLDSLHVLGKNITEAVLDNDDGHPFDKKNYSSSAELLRDVWLAEIIAERQADRRSNGRNKTRDRFSALNEELLDRIDRASVVFEGEMEILYPVERELTGQVTDWTKPQTVYREGDARSQTGKSADTAVLIVALAGPPARVQQKLPR